jgi:putative ABC transport system substrate-binding protein
MAWPAVARAQQLNRMQRVAVLVGGDENDPVAKARLSAFTQALADLGWTEGRNVRLDVRWTGDDINRMRTLAQELVGLQPDVILASGTPETVAVQRETRTIPIVFALVSDPVGEGFIASLPRPGGNITGFIALTMGGKWLELLTEIAPGVKRVAMIFNPDTSAGGGSYHLPSFDAAARTLKVQPLAAPVRSDAELETTITSLGREPGGGLIAMPGNFLTAHRSKIILLAAGNIIPAAYWQAVFAKDGGLLSYGPTPWTSFVAPRPMWIVFYAARSRRSYPFSCPPSSRWS